MSMGNQHRSIIKVKIYHGRFEENVGVAFVTCGVHASEKSIIHSEFIDSYTILLIQKHSILKSIKPVH